MNQLETMRQAPCFSGAYLRMKKDRHVLNGLDVLKYIDYIKQG
jgi:hypothetical protein